MIGADLLVLLSDVDGLYEDNPKKITGEIEKITNYRDRKKDLERRIKILEKSDLYCFSP